MKRFLSFPHNNFINMIFWTLSWDNFIPKNTIDSFLTHQCMFFVFVSKPKHMGQLTVYAHILEPLLFTRYLELKVFKL